MLIQLLKTVGVLAGIVGLIFLLAYFARRFGLGGAAGGGQTCGWRVLGVKALGPRRQVYALEVGSRILILGVSDKSIVSLAEVTDPDECLKIRDAVSPVKRRMTGFPEVLRKLEMKA